MRRVVAVPARPHADHHRVARVGLSPLRKHTRRGRPEPERRALPLVALRTVIRPALEGLAILAFGHADVYPVAIGHEVDVAGIDFSEVSVSPYERRLQAARRFAVF